MIRENRKNCIEKIGKDSYAFDKKRELYIYKSLCGIKLNRREWKRYKQDKKVPHNYHEWQKMIRDKYEVYTIEQLEEFIKYLEVRKRDKSRYGEVSNIISTALASSIISTAITFCYNQNLRIDKNENFVAFFASLMLFILVFSTLSVWSAHCLISPGKLEKEMYKDYQDIVKQILEEKGK